MPRIKEFYGIAKCKIGFFKFQIKMLKIYFLLKLSFSASKIGGRDSKILGNDSNIAGSPCTPSITVWSKAYISSWVWETAVRNLKGNS